MELVVTGTGGHRGTLTAGGRVYECALGRSGIVRDKREGDGATPAGRFPFRRLYYRADRVVPPPETGLPRAALAPTDGWCDTPGDPNYNRPVRLPYAASAEELWRTDSLYDLIAVIGHNDEPPRGDLGSAIFMHLATPGLGPTEGCVALAKADLLAVLAQLGPASTIEIAPG